MKEEAVVRMKEKLEDQTLKKAVAAAGYTVYKVVGLHKTFKKINGAVKKA